MPRWWKGKRSDRDFREEIESHLDLEADRQAAQRGLDPRDARYAAQRAFGNVTRAQERFYESQRWAWAERLRQHLRYAVRALRTHPGFSLAAIVTLGVGIGFNTAIFTVFYAVAFRALPVRDADRLVNVYQLFGGRYGRNVHGVPSMISYPEYRAYESVIDSGRGRGPLTSGAVYAQTDFAFDRSRTGAARGEYVSCNYFQVLGTRMTLGRGFVRDECRNIGEPAVAVLSHGTWTRDLGADSSVIGRVVRLNQIPFTVVGVAEPGFAGLTFLSSDVWVPVTMQPSLAHGRDSIAVRDWSWLTMAARLAPGATMPSARAQLSVVARRRDALYPGRETRVFVAKGALLNFPEVRQEGALAAGLIAALGALVVAMVCANIMNLLLARGIARRREIGIRLAIGASRGRLVEQLLTESAVLAVFGGLLGFAIAYVLPFLLPRVIPIPGLQLDLSPDGRVLAFSVIVSLITAVAFGLVPALQATGVDLVSAAKGGMSAGKRQIRPGRLHSFVVGVQVAGSALLLIVAALFIRAATRATTADPGYATRNIISFGFNMTQLGYTPERIRATYDALRDRVAAAPEVESAALGSPMPLLGRRSDSVDPEPASSPRQSRVDNVAMASVSGSYLATMQIPLIVGRAFNDAELPQDTVSDLPIVVSQSLASMLWGSEPALGNAVRMGGRRLVIVGIAADTRAVSLGSTTPFVYLPAIRDNRLRIVARVRGSMVELERMVPRWAHELDPSLVVDGQRFSERMALELMPARLSSAVAAIMGGLTMLLALVGIYGVVSYAVSQRTRDIAIRLALGSTQNGVVRLMMRQGSHAVVIGLLVGVAAAVGVAQVIRRFLLGVSPLDPVAYIGMAAILLSAALSAMYAPARRAARVDPALTLREE
jgi:predicted permease